MRTENHFWAWPFGFACEAAIAEWRVHLWVTVAGSKVSDVILRRATRVVCRSKRSAGNWRVSLIRSGCVSIYIAPQFRSLLPVHRIQVLGI